MERLWAQRLLVSTLLLQAPVLAQATNHSWNDIQINAVDTQASYEGTGQIGDVTRKNGGELYRLDLAKPLPLTAIKAKAKAGRLKIVSVNLVTDKNEKITIAAMSNLTLAETDKAIIADKLNATANIAGIEIRAEAMGGKASLDINAVSSVEAPKLALRTGGNDGNNGNDDSNDNGNGNAPAPGNGNSCSKKFDAILKDKLDVIQLWAGRADSSAAGSWQEKYASKEFTKFVNDFIATLKADKASSASTEYTLTLLNFFTERHNASRAESAAEAGYKAMATELFDVFMASVQTDDTCRAVSSDSLIKIALDFQKKQEANKPDSRARKIYDGMIGQIGKIVPTQYRKELAAKNMTFRQADNEGYKNYKLFANSKPESFLKGTYQEMSANAYAVAEQALTREVKSLDNEQTYQLIVEFQTKYNDAANYPQDIMMRYLTILSDHSNFLKMIHSK